MAIAEKLPGIMKSLFLGEIKENYIFPFPEIKEEEKETLDILLDTIDKFIKEKLDGKKIEEKGEIPKDIINQLSEIGIWGLTIPEEYGGFSLSSTSYCKAVGKISSACASTGITIGAHLSIGVKPILLFGNEEQKKKYLPSLASGEKLAAFALTEAEAGSDATKIKTTAELSEDKKYYILNGSKQWITNGALADIVIVFAKTKNGISSFIVEKEMGYKIGKQEEKCGIKSSSTTSLFFDNIEVPVENLIEPYGKGFKIAMETLNHGRMGLAGSCSAVSKYCLELATDFATKREQFGKKISAFDLIKEKISNIAVSQYVQDSTVFLTTGFTTNNPDTDFSVESAISKLFCTEENWNNINDALQIAGGNGYMKEYPYEKLMRDNRINLIFEGTNEIQKGIIGATALRTINDSIAKGKIDISKKLNINYNLNPILNDSVKVFEDGIITLYKSVKSAYEKYQNYTPFNQYVQERVSNICIYLYTLLSAISKTQHYIVNIGEDKADYWLKILKAWTYKSEKEINRNSYEITNNIDGILSEISDTVTKEEFIQRHYSL